MIDRRCAWFSLLVLAGVALAQDPPPEPPPPAGPAIDTKAERKLTSQVNALAVSPDGKWIAAGGYDGSVVLFATGSAERRDAGTVDNRVVSLVFTADSQWVVAEPQDREDNLVLVAADVATGKVLRKMDVSAPDPPTGSREKQDRFSMACPVPGSARVELLRNVTVEVWDLATGERVEQRPNKDPWVQHKVRAADGSLLVIDGSGPLRVVDGATGAARFEITPDGGGMKGNLLIGSHSTRAVGFATAVGVLLLRDTWEETKDPKTLTGDNVDKRTKEFRKLLGVSTTNGKELWKRDLAQYVFADDVKVGAEVAAVPDDGKVTFIHCATGQVREKAPAAKRWSCVAVSPDGLTFWGGSDDGTVSVLKTFPPPKAK